MELEVRLKLEIPNSVVLPDGTTAQVKGVSANVVDGELAEIVYTIEKESGAWAEYPAPDIQQHPQQLVTSS
jgi:hypothetical protein